MRDVLMDLRFDVPILFHFAEHVGSFTQKGAKISQSGFGWLI